MESSVEGAHSHDLPTWVNSGVKLAMSSVMQALTAFNDQPPAALPLSPHLYLLAYDPGKVRKSQGVGNLVLIGFLPLQFRYFV